jgi:hypothetical protein
MPCSVEDLRAARRTLFDALPISSDCLALMSFQRQVVEEILRSEAERGDSPAIGRHIHAVRSYGDCLAFQQLSTYALRQLRRNSGKPPDLSGQRAAFRLPLDLCAAANEAGVPAILCDATNVLRTGDVVLCRDPDLPDIIECKASQRAPDPRFLRQGRRGRQLARIEKVTEFLRTGKGQLFGDPRLRRTIELKHVPQFDFAPVDKMVSRALNHDPCAEALNEYQVYVACILGEEVDYGDLLRSWSVGEGECVMIAAASEPLRDGWADIRPPAMWETSAECRWALMEGDVSLLHLVRANALVGIGRGDIKVVAAVPRPADVEADTTWVYRLDVGDEPMFMSPSALYHMAYGHETLESCRERMLEAAEWTVKFHGSADEARG